MLTQIERWLAEGEALVAHKDYALALIPLNHATREAARGPQSSAAWLLQSRALEALGHNDQALAAADHAVQDQPGSVEALQQRAWVYQLLKRYAEAIDDWERVTRLEPDQPRHWERLGSACLDVENNAAALEAYERALALQPDLPRAAHGKAIALNGLGRRNESLAAYQHARQVIPIDDPIYIWVVTNSALALQSAHHLSEALALAEQASHLDAPPDDRARAWCVTGNILMNLRRYPEALASYEQACVIAPQYPSGWHGKGGALIALDQPEAALAATEEALRLDPSNRQFQHARQSALAYALLTQTPRLAADAPAFAEITDPDIWREQVQRFVALRRAPELEAAANQALRLDPSDFSAYVYKAMAQIVTRRFRAAAATMRQGWHAPVVRRQNRLRNEDGAPFPK